jgi:outer membrane protein assembly factor BamB
MVVAALLFSGCSPCALPRMPRDAPVALPKRTGVPERAPAPAVVKDLHVPGEVLAVNDRYVVNIDNSRLQVRDRNGKLIYEPPRTLGLGRSSNSKVCLAASLLYVAVETEKKPGRLVSDAWVIDPARKRLTRLPRLARVLRLASQDVVFGGRFVAISEGQKLTVFDLAKHTIVGVYEKPRSFAPIGWQSDGRLIGASDGKPDRRTPGDDIIIFNPADRSLRWLTNFPEGVQLGGGVLGEGHVVARLTSLSEDMGPASIGRSLLVVIGLSSRTRTFMRSNGDDMPLFVDKRGILYFARSGHLGLWKMRVFGRGSLGRSAEEFAAIQGRVHRIWAASMPDDVDGDICLAPDGTVYVPTFAHLVAVRSDGRVKWRVKIGAYMPGSVVATGGAVYVGAKDLRAYGSHGRLRWKRGRRGTEINGLALGPDGTIYLGDATGHLHAFDGDGTQKWRRTVAVGRQSHASRPAVAPDATIYVASSRGNLHAFTPGGRAKWTFDGGSRAAYDPIVGPSGDIYFSVEETTGARLYAVRPDGKMRWARKCADIVADLAVAPDGTIYFGDYPRLRALDDRGQVKWSLRAKGGLFDPVPGREGTVYASSESGGLCAIDGRGKKIWEYQTGSDSAAMGALDRDGIIYATTADALLALEVR